MKFVWKQLRHESVFSSKNASAVPFVHAEIPSCSISGTNPPSFLKYVRLLYIQKMRKKRVPKGNKVESFPSTPYMSWHYSVFWGETSKFLLKCNLEFFLQWWAKSEPIMSLILLKWSSVNKTLDFFKKSYHYHCWIVLTQS